MKDEFRQWFVSKGYSVITPSGNLSTVYDYANRIDKVCQWEDMTWLALAAKIEPVVKEYSAGGVKSERGNKSHRAVINALLRFEEFLSAGR